MKLARLVAVSGLILAACVPSIEEPDPAGAAGFVTEPSPASRGEPFTTDDGWTIRFEELVLHGSPGATPEDGPPDPSAGAFLEAAPDAFRWNARDRVEVYARALSVSRTWRVSVSLRGASPPDNEGREHHLIDHGVDPKLARRFREPTKDADEPIEYATSPATIVPTFPATIVILHAEKDGRSVRLDVALSTLVSSSPREDSGVVIEVRANALATVPLTVRAERLFLTEEERFEFEPFAAADAAGDGDGNLTIEELRSVRLPGPDGSSRPEEEFPQSPDGAPGAGQPGRSPRTLLGLLRSRLPSMLP